MSAPDLAASRSTRAIELGAPRAAAGLPAATCEVPLGEMSTRDLLAKQRAIVVELERREKAGRL